MLLSILAGVVLLLVLGYFGVLIVSECAFWLHERLSSTRQPVVAPAPVVRQERPLASR